MFTNKYNKKTYFVKNVNSVNSVILPEKYTTNIEYNKLIGISDILDGYLDASSNTLLLDNDKYTELSVILNNSLKDTLKYPEYEKLRVHLKNVLEFTYLTRRQIVINSELNKSLNDCGKTELKYKDILKNVDTINEYLRSLGGQFTGAFPESEITVIKAEILPLYALYINNYGYPEDGIFDADKLATITKLLV